MEQYYTALRYHRYGKAEKILKKLIEAYPEEEKLLAEFYAYRKRYLPAYRIYMDLMKKTKNEEQRAEYLKKALAMLTQAGKKSEVIRIARRYEDQFVSDRSTRRYLIRLYLANGLLDDAARISKKILKKACR